MAVLCRMLIAVTLVVHLTVGCCTHHAHGCEKDCPAPAHADEMLGGQCLDSDCDHSHHGTNDCQGAKCSFVSSGRTVGNSLGQAFQAFVAGSLNDRPSLAGIGSNQCPLSSGRLLLPIRLHLANQVLLI